MQDTGIKSLYDKNKICDFPEIEFDEDEQILWVGKPNLKVFILNSIFEFILIVLSILIFFFGMNYINNRTIGNENISGLEIFTAIITALYATSIIKTAFHLRGFTYIITNKCIIRHQKKNGIKCSIINFQYILTKEIKRSIPERLSGAGKIQIYTGHTKKDEDNQTQKVFYYLYTIKNPECVYQLIGTWRDYIVKYKTET